MTYILQRALIFTSLRQITAGHNQEKMAAARGGAAAIIIK